ALARNIDPIRDLLFASAAFPIAFAPQHLAYCLSEPPAAEGPFPAPTCPRPDHDDDFIDGGVFDNKPLGLAVRLATLGLRRNGGGQLGWRDPATGTSDDPGLPRGAIRYVYLDPDNTAYPNPILPTHGGGFGPKLLLQTVARLAEAFVSTSRGKELYTLAQTNP